MTRWEDSPSVTSYQPPLPQRKISSLSRFSKRYLLRHGGGFPGGASGKQPTYRAEVKVRSLSRDLPGGGNGNPLQYSCLENPLDRGAWQATVHRVAQSQTRLSDSAHTHTRYRGPRGTNTELGWIRNYYGHLQDRYPGWSGGWRPSLSCVGSFPEGACSSECSSLMRCDLPLNEH